MIDLRAVLFGAVMVFFCATGTAVADAAGMPAIPFVDGSWHEDIVTGPASSEI